MKHLLPALLGLVLIGNANAQNEQANGELSDSSKATLRILSVFPDSFPNVSVVFRAEDKNGNPVWSLNKQNTFVKENGAECAIVSIEPITTMNSLRIGLVLDHSGSMGMDMDPEDQPINAAKTAAKRFINSFGEQLPNFSLVGFSTEVDVVLPISQDTATLRGVIDSLRAMNTTAFYDALMVSMKLFEGGRELDVIVALTDGMDNASKTSLRAMIDEAKRLDIPLYMVGLGDVNTDTLRLIATETGGQFLYAQRPAQLDSIYQLISQRIQAFYDLVYLSPNVANLEAGMEVSISFQVDEQLAAMASKAFNLAPEVLAHLAEKEARIETDQRNRYIAYGAIGLIVLLLGAGTILYTRAKQKEKLAITNLYPNPAIDIVNVEIIGMPTELQILNSAGALVHKQAVNSGNHSIPIDHLPNGTYIIMVTGGSHASANAKLIVKH